LGCVKKVEFQFRIFKVVLFIEDMSEDISKVLEKIESKRKESERFIAKYNTRGMQDLEEYYKGAKWALEYVQKIIKEHIKQNK